MHMPKSIHRPLSYLPIVLAACSCALLGPAAVHADDPAPVTARKPAKNPNCPADIPGTTIMAAPIRDGATLTFLAPPRHVVELRRRVRALSAVQNEGAVTPPENAPITRVPENEPHEPVASVYNVHGGALLKFTPSKADQLGDVQARVLEYAQHLAGGNCPLVLDRSTVLRTGTRKTGSPSGQVPAGLVPGVGPIDNAAVITTPSLIM
jgi:hypothetical protein